MIFGLITGGAECRVVGEGDWRGKWEGSGYLDQGGGDPLCCKSVLRKHVILNKSLNHMSPPRGPVSQRVKLK